MSVPADARAVQDGVKLSILVQPRALCSWIVGAHGDALKMQLAAPPVHGDGAANEALIDLAADVFGVPKRAVSLVSGQTSRRERIRLQGLDVAAIEAVMKKGS